MAAPNRCLIKTLDIDTAENEAWFYLKLAVSCGEFYQGIRSEKIGR